MILLYISLIGAGLIMIIRPQWIWAITEQWKSNDATNHRIFISYPLARRSHVYISRDWRGYRKLFAVKRKKMLCVLMSMVYLMEASLGIPWVQVLSCD